MKAKVIIIINLLFSYQMSTIAQSWQWSKQIGGSDLDLTGATCMDAGNNLYVTGKFLSNPCYFHTDTLIPNGISDFFVVKYDPFGNELWVKGFGGQDAMWESEGITDIRYDSVSNCIYFCGGFVRTCVFDSITLHSAGTSVGYGYSDGFIVKADLNGNVIWAKKSGGEGGSDVVSSIAISDGKLYAIQCIYSINPTIDSVPVYSGVYFCCYDLNGNLQWVKIKSIANITPNKYDAVFTRIKIMDDKIFAIGECYVDSFTVDSISVIANYQNGQSLISCFDTSANAIWIKPCANSNGGILDIIVDINKNCYITGYFYNEGIFENDTLLANVYDLYFAKYDSLGNKIWVYQTNSQNGATGNGLDFDLEGNFYMSGTIRNGTSTFGTFSVSPSLISMFLARFDTSGSCIGIRYEGFAGGWKVKIDGNGDAYVNGTFENSISFNPTPTLSSYGNSDIYVAKSSAIVGIEEVQGRAAGNELIIYANPTNGSCQAVIPDEFMHEKNLTMQIYDNTGRLLQQTRLEMKQDKIKINLEQEAKGIYQVVLSNGRKSYNGKIVFE